MENMKYQPPEVTVIGTLADITMGNGKGPNPQSDGQYYLFVPLHS